MAIAQLSSRIDKVKLYAAGATISRIAEFEEAPDYVEIPGLPLALDDSSVRVRVEAASGTPAIAADIRIGLSVPPRSEPAKAPTDDELRAARAEVHRIEDLISLIENEINVLYRLEVPARPDGEPGKAPPPSPTSARLALANFSDEQIRDRMKEKRETLEKLRTARERLDDLQQQQALASSAREVRENELRKTAIVRLNYQGQPSTVERQQLIVEYFVPGARWTPSYVCRLDSKANAAAIAVRALICQRTGEDWAGVRLELSTASPLMQSELPELASLRVGRAQPLPRKSGWRRAPIGAEMLFEDFDRQKEAAAAAARRDLPEIELSEPSLAPLPNLKAIAKPVIGIVDDGIQCMSEELEEEESDEDFENMYVGGLGTVEEDRMTFEMFDALAAQSTRSRRLRTREIVELAAPPSAAKKLGKPRGKDAQSDFLAYGLMRMGEAENPLRRGKLFIEQQQELYLEILSQHQKVVVSFNPLFAVQKAVFEAQSCLSVNLPPGGINVREVAGSFDYAYSADGRIDVPSDGVFHSVALTSQTATADVRYVVVPREDTNVFRIAQLRNPLAAPLLAGAADVYVDGEYILSTNIATVPPLGQMELGLGVEQAIKVSRNTFYEEVRSGETLVAFNELRHKIEIEIVNHLPRLARIEVRERIPIPQDGAKVDVQFDRLSLAWEEYKQDERGAPIRGGYRQQVEVPAKDKIALLAQYIIKTFIDSEIVGGNRRE